MHFMHIQLLLETCEMQLMQLHMLLCVCPSVYKCASQTVNRNRY